MSIIFGAINFDGDTDIQKAFGEMHQRLSRFPSDRFQQQEKGNHYRFGCMVRAFRKSSDYDQSPLVYQNIIVSCHSRIDNREELLKVFGYNKSDLHFIPDSQLIAEAYLKWGNQWASHVLGEFVVAIYDKPKNEVILFKDFLGQTALYYTFHNGTLYYSSSLVGLAMLPLNVNYDYLAGILHRNHKAKHETAYLNIFCVLSNHFVRINREAEQTKSYYKVPKKTIKYKTDEEYFEHFRELYYHSVKRRLSEKSGTASCLSGGLDSGSVAAIASRLLKQQGKPLHAYTMSSKYVKDFEMDERHFADEMRLAKLNVSHNGNMIHHLIQEEKNDILKELDLSYQYSASPHFSSNSYWLRLIFEGAKNDGCDTLLNGQHGNLTVSWKGNQGNTLLWYLSRADKRFVKGFLIRMFPWLQTKRGRRNVQYENIGLHNEFLSKYQVEELWESYLLNWRNMQFGSAFDIKSEMLGLNNSGSTGWEDMSHYTGVHATDPTADQELVEFCMNVSNDVFCKGKETRRLIRLGLQEELPDEIRLNYQIGTQGLDNSQYLRENKEVLNDFLSDDSLKGLIDHERLLKTLDELTASQGVDSFYEKGYSFLSLLGICFFEQQNKLSLK